MSGFDSASMLPYYLDEADEQIAALNDTLLRLEQAPDDEKALRDAFRLVHTLKGSSTILGFDQVKGLTHHLETFFDRLRSRQRSLDRPFLDLCFRCLDGLRDYHRDLRTSGQSDIELSGLSAMVLALLDHPPAATEETPPTSPAEPDSHTDIHPGGGGAGPSRSSRIMQRDPGSARGRPPDPVLRAEPALAGHEGEAGPESIVRQGTNPGDRSPRRSTGGGGIP